MPNLTPNKEMSEAALAALLTATDVDPRTLAVTQSIAAQRELDPNQVLGLSEFYKAHTSTRPAGDVEDTPWNVQWQLHGGDAGKAWANARLRELVNEDVALSDATEVAEFKEMFLADGPVEEDADGLIWKQMIHEGTWREGPNGRPIHVVAGHSKDATKVIGMQDIVDAFNDNAVQHVTVPLSHEDRSDENTGYIKKMAIKAIDGVNTLVGGHDFTDPTVKEKVKNRSIANTSVGLRFNFKRKEDGKHYPVVMYHNALTQKPWLSRLAPFGINASEPDENYATSGLQFSEVLTEEVKSAVEEQTLSTTTDPASTLPAMDPVTPSTQPAAPVQVPAVAVTPPPAPPLPAAPVVTPEFVLSEDPKFKAVQDENARLRATVDQLAAGQKTRDADDRIKSLKAIGFTEEAGCTAFLTKVRDFCLADTQNDVVMLSDETAGEHAKFSVTGVIDELIAALPRDKDSGKLAFSLSEQVTDPLGQSAGNKPPVGEGDADETPIQFKARMDAMFADIMPSNEAREVAAASAAALAAQNA